jgi:hypothetical protein
MVVQRGDKGSDWWDLQSLDKGGKWDECKHMR